MQKDIAAYFNQIVIPLLEDRYLAVAREMSIQIRGSYGLGIADEYSDLDAILWLDDPMWKEEGGQVQLALENDIPRFGATDILSEHGHAEVNVWPLSWLGHRRQFLNDTLDMPWELVSFEELFEIQRNLVLRDPQSLFRRLREATRPENFPEALWRKRLIQNMKKLDDDITEYCQVIRRDRRMEGAIISGRLVQDLLHLGFLISRQYYPWPTHLHWAFSKLAPPATEVSPHLETLSGQGDPDEKLSAARQARETYASAILERGLLSAEILDDLVWAERLEAWSKENWRDWIENCRKKARAAGHQPKDFWIWSLWGW